MNRIIRVFPTRTNMTPNDEYSFIGSPGLFIPEHDKIHISVTFTWDKKKALKLFDEWKSITNKSVCIGGPAFNDPGCFFDSGMYLKKGVIITSRGCPNNCNYCLVPKREGRIKEYNIENGNIIQDNNILACSDIHINKLFEMLKHQKNIEFKGGLESRRITNKIAEKLRGLRIKSLWLACDTLNRVESLIKAVNILQKAGFKQNQVRCYVLIGDDINENRNRLQTVYKIGCLPFAQLYQSENKIDYSEEWKKFAREWSRPAIYKSFFK